MTKPHKHDAVEPLEEILIPEFSRALRLLDGDVPHQMTLELQQYLARQIVTFSASKSLGDTLQKQEVVLPTQVVSSLNETEKFWRDLQEEFGLFTSTEVAEALGAKASRSYASEQLKTGKLLAIRRLNRNLFPGFQIKHGQIRPSIPRLIALGKECGRSDMDIIFWLCSPTTYLDGGARPVEMLDDLDSVLGAASRAWNVVW